MWCFFCGMQCSQHACGHTESYQSHWLLACVSQSHCTGFAYCTNAHHARCVACFRPVIKLLSTIQAWKNLRLQGFPHKYVNPGSWIFDRNFGQKSRKSKKVVCSECGWSWKLSEGGHDPYTCHKCGNVNSKSELTEKCWAGYTQKGMKTMFGKRYPNCVKKTK